jgi:MFS family permease
VRRAHLIACCAPPVLLAVDFAVLSVAAPQLRADLAMSDAEVRWLFSAYNLAFGCLLLAAGRAADAYGRRRMLLAGLVIFAAAAAVTALARTGWTAIAGRTLQGAGAAAMTPAALSLLTAATPHGDDRSRVLAAYGLAISTGFVAGTLISGALATAASWRPAVAVAIPLAGVAIVMARRLPRDDIARPRAAAARRRRAVETARARRAVETARARRSVETARGRRIAGGPPPVVGVAALVAAAALGAAHGGPEGLTVTVLAAGGLLVLAARLGRAVAVACGAGMIVTATGVGGTLLLTLYLQDVRGYSPLAAGAIFACFGAAAIPGAVAARRLRAERGVATGLAAQGGGLLLAAPAAASGSAPAIVASVAGFGFGHVIGNASVAAVATARAAAARHGELAGMLITAQYLGGALGPTVLGRASFQAGMVAAGAAAVAAAALTWLVDASA